MQDTLSKSELLQVAADSTTMGRAQALLQEEKDEVKHMNRIMRYAKCAAVRDKQVQVGDTCHAGLPGKTGIALSKCATCVSSGSCIGGAPSSHAPAVLLWRAVAVWRCRTSNEHCLLSRRSSSALTC